MCIFNVNLWAGHDLLARVLTDCPPTCPMARDPSLHGIVSNAFRIGILGQMAESKVPDDTFERILPPESPRIPVRFYEYWFSSSLWPYVTTSLKILKTHETIKKYLHFTCIADLHWFAFSRCWKLFYGPWNQRKSITELGGCGRTWLPYWIWLYGSESEENSTTAKSGNIPFGSLWQVKMNHLYIALFIAMKLCSFSRGYVMHRWNWTHSRVHIST